MFTISQLRGVVTEWIERRYWNATVQTWGMRKRRVTKQSKDHWQPTTSTKILITMIITTTVTTDKMIKACVIYINTSDIITYKNEYN